MYVVSGEILTKDGLEKGYLLIDKGIIVESGKITPLKPIAKGYIIPKPINAHTHLGDAFIRDKIKELPRDIEKLVAPPDGLKHRMLKNADDAEVIQGMRGKLREMIRLGVYAFCDFREGGLKGVSLLKAALDSLPIDSIVLSRPKDMEFKIEEIESLLDMSDGIGVSSITDWNYEDLMRISDVCNRRKKIFSLHASERIREDIDRILDLKPRFLVHMVKASRGDLERVSEENMPIVVCPRSNQFFGIKPDVGLMVKMGIDVSLGTDNAMISDPNIYDEAKWVKENFKDIPIDEILKMMTYNPRDIFGIETPDLLEGNRAEMVVVDTKSLKPIFVSQSEVKI